MVVPYSKATVVEAPLGLTVPFKVAELEVTEVAVSVEREGGEEDETNSYAPMS